MADVQLRVEGLSKSYGDELAVDDLSMSVDQGDLKTLLGPSGCGKTTTLRCIAGLERPDAGEIYIGDKLVSAPEKGVHVSPQERRIGMVFQMHSLWPHMTVKENLMFPLRHQKIGTKAEREQRVSDILEVVQLERYVDSLSSNLSGGQQQRVALSRALITEPEVLLLDEPLSSLDEKLRSELRVELQRINDELETTMLYVTHSQEEALYMSDDIAIMRDGKLVEEGDPDKIYYDPDTYFGMSFIGNINTLEGTVVSTDDGVLTVDTPVGTIRSRDTKLLSSDGEEVLLAFRANNCVIDLADSNTAAADEGTVLEGTLRDVRLDQKIVEYLVIVDDTELLIHSSARLPVEAGDPIRVHLDLDDVKIYALDGVSAEPAPA